MEKELEIIQLAIVDDEQLFVTLLESFFALQPQTNVLLTAISGEIFLKQLEQLEQLPDIVLLDLSMKDIDGMETISILKEKFPTIKIIVVSSYYKKSCIGHMLRMGVNAFLPKGVLPMQLLEIIKIVAKIGYHFLPDQLETLSTQITPKAPKPQYTIAASITLREKEILDLICQQYTAQEIADKLFITKRTVEGHKNSLLSKIGVKNTAGLVIYAIQNNIVNINNLQY